jgi:hypothetical protein
MQSKIQIRLLQKQKLKDKLLFDGVGRNAGLEVEGDIAKMIRGIK